MRFSGILILVPLALCSGFASAQQQQQPPANRAASSTPSRPDGPSAAPKAMNNNDAAVAGQAMARNGGSLLKATLATTADPAQAQLDSVSFFSVPPPEPSQIAWCVPASIGPDWSVFT